MEVRGGGTAGRRPYAPSEDSTPAVALGHLTARGLTYAPQSAASDAERLAAAPAARAAPRPRRAFLSACTPQEAPLLDTSKLQPFEGADVKWQKIIDAKDEAELRAKARRGW